MNDIPNDSRAYEHNKRAAKKHLTNRRLMASAGLALASLGLGGLSSAGMSLADLSSGLSGGGGGGGGWAMGLCAKPGEVFTDERGRKYTRDEKGTIRRVKP